MLAGLASAARAQEPPVGPRLPVLLDHSPAAYPERALERGIEGTVLLELTVDEDGRVIEVALLEEAGHGFDMPAVEAAWTMQFEPALDEKGRPAAAKIRYRYAYDTGDIPPLAIEGVVRERGNRKAIANAVVKAVGPNEEVARTRSDDTGRFRLAELPAGDWVLTVSGPGLTPSSAGVKVPEEGYAEGIVLSVERIPEWEDVEFEEYVEVTMERVVDPAEQELSRDVVVTLPGSLGDPVRALQNLPGVARAPFGSGQLMVRGTSNADTVYLASGMEIPIAFHFTAVSTVVSADVLSGVEFQPGGFGARYGRALGGVVDLAIDDTIPKKGVSSASADVFQATAFTRQRLGKSTSLVLAARRSYIDTIAQPVLASMGAGALKVPRFYDAQLHLVRRLEGTGLVSGTLLLSEDRFRVLDPEDGGDALLYRTSFQKGMFRYVQPFEDGWSLETAVSIGPEVQELLLGGNRDAVAAALGIPFDPFGDIEEGEIREEALPRYALRVEMMRDPGDQHVGGRYGVDWLFGPKNLVYTVGEAETGTMGISEPALYGEMTVRLGPLDLIPGMRLEAFDTPAMSAVRSLDPRARAVLDLGPTSFTATAGRYSQPPASRELLSVEGPTLGMEQAESVSAGVDQRLGPDAKLGVTAYAQRTHDLVVGREGIFRFDQTTLSPFDDFEPFANDGTGRSFGVEVFGALTTDERILWLAATISRSFVTDRPWLEEHPAESDQPVNLTLIGSQQFGHWRVGARTRYATGPSMTPVLGGVYATDLQAWLPIYGDPYSDRAPSFFAVDIRIDREWWFRSWKLAFYTEVQNATNHVNVEVPGWSEDFSELEPVTGLPIFPALGVKATW